MGTATILGDTYQTVVMPDGKEWVNKFRYDALGRWFLDDSGDPNALEFGKYYTYTERDTIAGLLTDGWRIPTADDFTGLFASTAPARLCGTGTTYWILGQGTDDYGFTQQAGGFCNSVGFYNSQITWWAPASEAYIWGAAVGPLTGLLVLDGDNPTLVATQSAYDPSGDPSRGHNLWLVRTPPDLTPVDRAESVSYDYRLALDWDTALDGTPICIDDGATYDYIESTITMRLTPTELAEWEAAWEGNGIVYPPGTGRLLGPTVDHSGADIACTLQDFVIDGPADSAMTLFDVTARLHYNGLGTPSAGSPSPLMDRGVPYHSIRPGYRSIILDSGGAAVVPYSGASTRMTKWYSSGLTLSEAQDAINWLRTLRGSQYAWTVGGTGFPFGPSESQTNTIWIPAWRCLRESNFTYGFELEIVLDG